MPMYSNALINTADDDIRIVKEENSLLKSLNNEPCNTQNGKCYPPYSETPYYFNTPQSLMTADNSGVQTKFFGGNGEYTISTIKVTPQDSGYTGELYKDGIPTSDQPVLNKAGDGTVLLDSLRFLPELPYAIQNASHAQLIKQFATRILEFITGSSYVEKSSDLDEETPSPVLSITIEGKAEPTLVAPTGSGEMEKVNKLTSSYVVLLNPASGEYTVNVNQYIGDYTISISYITPNGDDLSVKSYHFMDDSDQVFHFSLASSNNIVLGRKLNPPEYLSIVNLSGKIGLTWTDPVGFRNGDVDHYEIYRRLDNKPYYEYIGSSDRIATYYATNDDFTEASNNEYVVRSVLRSGTKTAFSDPTFCRGN